MTLDQPLVSVVIPCHNQAQFLGDAIDSVVRQTYPNLEIVIVDDGSTDETPEVARRHLVLLLTQPRRGVCAAVNRGVRASRGEFVMRLDADDVLEPTYIEHTLAALMGSAAHFAYTAVAYFGAASGTYPVEEFSIEGLAERNFVHASAMMRRASFDAVGGYDEAMADARCEDWDLWLGFAERDMPGVLVRTTRLHYRQHARSRNTLAWRSPGVWRRNLMMANRLQRNHPRLFSPGALVRRLARLPGRLVRGEASPRFASLLLSLYTVMLAGAATRLIRPRHMPAAKTHSG
jgi:glycosyltransferase involved in cell wall biosynthesis